MPRAVQLAMDTGFDHAVINKYRGSIDGLKLNAFFDGILGQVGA